MKCPECGSEGMVNDWDLDLKTGEECNDRWKCLKCGHEEKVEGDK